MSLFSSPSKFRVAVPAAIGAVVLGGTMLVLAGAAHAVDNNQWMREAFQNTSSSATPRRSYGSWGFDTGRGREMLLPRGNPTLAKDGIAQMSDAIARYREIVKKGGWKPIPEEAAKIGLRAGHTHKAVAFLRARLEATGDMRPSSSTGFSTTFDYYVTNGLKRFQARHGLKPTGTLENESRRDKNGSRTLAALNVSAQSRLTQLRVNRNRLRSHASKVGKRYVVVNIPAQQVEAVAGGRVAMRHTAVVGKPDRKTPLLSSRIHEINFNPTWTLPPTVVREDLIPRGRRMQGGKIGVLEKFEIDAYTGYGGRKLDPTKVNWRSSAVYNYVYRQEPGPSNPLGFVKINFHNAHSVYMHDTPSQRIFGRADRAASSGCIRVQGIEKLVGWILRDNDGWSDGRVRHMKQSGETKNVSVRRPTPLHFIYVTAWTTPEGRVNFREDLYGYDRKHGVSRLASNY